MTARVSILGLWVAGLWLCAAAPADEPPSKTAPAAGVPTAEVGTKDNAVPKEKADEKKDEKKEGEEKKDEKKEWPPNFAEMLHLQPQVPEEFWLPPTSGPFSTFTAPITERDDLVVQPFFFYNWTRGVYDQDAHYHPRQAGEVNQSAVYSLFMQYGLLDNMEVDAQLFLNNNMARLPAEHVTMEEAQEMLDEYQHNLENGELFGGQLPQKAGAKRASSTGLGDTLLMLRYNLLHQTNAWWCPETSLLTQIKLPTGKYQHANPDDLGTDIMGTGSTDLTVGLDFTKAYRPLILHADLWYSWPLSTRVDGVDTRYGNYVNWNLGMEIPFLKDKLAYMLEFNGLHQASTREDGELIGGTRSDNIILGTGLEFLFSDNVQVLVGYQRTLWGRNVDATDSIGATLVWSFGMPWKKKE